MHPHLRLGVTDQIATDVHCDAVKCASELEWRSILVPDWRAAVGAAHKSTTQSHRQRHGKSNFSLPSQLAVNLSGSLLYLGALLVIFVAALIIAGAVARVSGLGRALRVGED